MHPRAAHPISSSISGTGRALHATWCVEQDGSKLLLMNLMLCDHQASELMIYVQAICKVNDYKISKDGGR